MGRLIGHSPITNIAELFAALAVGWGDKSRMFNRYIIAGDGGQFVRTPETGRPHCFYELQPQDIRIDSGNYGMRGFIRFEARIMYPDMFRTSWDCQDVYLTAELTQKGFEFAQVGVNDVVGSHPDVDRCSFFNPAAQPIIKDPALTHCPTAIGHERSA